MRSPYKIESVNMKNRQLSQNVFMSLNTRHTDLNNNWLVIGGSGCGKSFRLAKPLILSMSSSYIITDPKGELIRDTAGFLKMNGYKIKCLNLVEPKKGSHYNPFRYIRSDTDVIKLIGNLIKNTTPKGTSPSDPFWEKAEGLFLQSIFQYVWREGVWNEETKKIEHNVGAVFKLMNEADFKEDNQGNKLDSPLDLRMNDLEARDPKHPAVLKYNKVMRGAADTVRSIIISANSRLAPVENDEIIEMMSDDEIDFEMIGAERTAVYCVIPDSDDTYNFLVGLLYTQMFQELYFIADHVYDGELPIHVTYLLDEFANVALPDGYCSLLSTMRSRGISSIIIIQNMAQIKALFEKTYETIQGNCDTLIFLGSNERETQKYISEMMGKQTIYKTSSGITRGKNGSSSSNEDVLGRELMLPDEIRKLRRDECIILVNGHNPVKDKKIDTVNHPFYDMMVKASKNYFFDARLERNYGNDEFQDAFISGGKAEQYQRRDVIDFEEWKKEKMICEKIGKEIPKKPKKRIAEIDVATLYQFAISEDNLEDISIINWDEELNENEVSLNMEQQMEQYEREKQFEYDNTFFPKEELQSPKEARLYLRLKKENYSIPCIRELLKLSRSNDYYTEDNIANYFDPEMELEEIKECVEIMLLA